MDSFEITIKPDRTHAVIRTQNAKRIEVHSGDERVWLTIDDAVDIWFTTDQIGTLKRMLGKLLTIKKQREAIEAVDTVRPDQVTV